MDQDPLSAQMHLNTLIQFRQAVYDRLGPARDALFEVCDAALLAQSPHAFVHLSTSPVFRRRWSSAYEALQDSCPDRTGLLTRYLAQIPSAPRPVLAGDHTAWPRLSAYTLRERTVEHQPTRLPKAKPITLGQGFSSLAWIPQGQGSWALPLLHERIAPEQTPISKAVAQLRRVCPRLPQRPVVWYDAEYGCAPFVNASADIPCDKLVRLRANLCLWGAPPPYPGRGRPAKHGQKFKLSDASTWGPPDETLEVNDPLLGAVRRSLWRDKHLKRAADHSLLVLRLERLGARGTRRDPKGLWRGWLGEPPPPLAAWWRLYLRRCALDHWYRFAKHSLHWTLPRLKTPEQAERWSDLMPLLSWELWLARLVVADKPLPWQKAQQALTPGRVKQGFGGLLALIGTPACAPKPRGKSPGWPKGRQRNPAPRCAVVKKARAKRFDGVSGC